MTTERWRRIEEIYQAAADLDPRERADLLKQTCGTDGALRQEIEDLLSEKGDIEAALEAAVRNEAEELAARESKSAIGKRFGPYRVTAVIGTGGMGTVYRAVRDDDQFQKEVAIKVVKRGMNFDALQLRFRHERQILARLDHPHIGRLLDGGVTDDGLPYFVMEFIEGVPLTDYCAGKLLPERLRLFREVCAAVQYAHQNLIVHRDLKPANILVTDDGVPKLLDFGLAKLLYPGQLPEQTFTMVRILTPDYASPEQVRGEPITTVSDIYSLGALLYELVSGRRAHRFESRTTSEMERVVCHTDPLPLPGEIGSIVQMALRKEPGRRYATVEHFSDDIGRYLEGIPVQARKDTLAYRLRKFVRRNKWAVVAGGFACMAVAGGMGAVWYQSQRAEQNAREALRFAATLTGSINNKLGQLKGTLEVRRELVRSTSEYLEQLSRDAPSDPAFQVELSKSYLRLAMFQYDVIAASLHQFEPALASLQKARTIAESIQRRDPNRLEMRPLLTTVFDQIGMTLTGMGRDREALEWYRKALDLSQGVTPEMLTAYQAAGLKRDPGLIRFQMAIESVALGDYRTAMKQLPDGSAHKAEALVGIGDLETAWRSMGPGARRIPVRQNPFMQDLFQFGWRYESAVIAGHPLRLHRGDAATALILARECVKRWMDALRADPADGSARTYLAISGEVLGAILRESNPEESVSTYRMVIDRVGELLDQTPSNLKAQRMLAEARAEVAFPLRKLGKPEEARKSLLDARKVEEAIGEPRAFTRNELGDLELAAGNREEAVLHYQAALDLAKKRIEVRPQDMQARRELADTYERLGHLYELSRQWAVASEWHRKSLGVWRTWTEYGISSVYNERREEQAAAAVLLVRAKQVAAARNGRKADE
jgi:eukaryotic-like serine/threonine-protein kinase